MLAVAVELHITSSGCVLYTCLYIYNTNHNISFDVFRKIPYNGLKRAKVMSVAYMYIRVWSMCFSVYTVRHVYKYIELDQTKKK